MRQFLNGNTFANDARMRRSIFKGAFVFLEGDSDERLFGGFFDRNRCQIITTNGKEKLLEACQILEAAAFSGFLGIKDSDFARIDGNRPTLQNLILTNFHDAECFLLRGSAFDRVLVEFVAKDRFEKWCKLHGTDVRQTLLACAVNIGYLLWHSESSKLALHFSNLEIREFVDRDSLVLDVAKLVEHVKQKSQRHDLDSQTLIGAISLLESKQHDPWQVVRGHDMAELMGFAFRRAWGNWAANEVTPDRLEQSLRLAYPSEEFAQTQICAHIREWERNNGAFAFLKEFSTKSLFQS